MFASPGPKTRRRNQSGGNNSDDSDSGVVVNEIDYKVSQTHFADFFRKLLIFDSQKNDYFDVSISLGGTVMMTATVL